MSNPDEERKEYENKMKRDFRDTGYEFEEAVDKQVSVHVYLIWNNILCIQFFELFP